MENYFDIAFTPAVRAMQEQKGSIGVYDRSTTDSTPDALEPAEVELISTRDSFYMATVTESGWPYVQHKGGEAGFVKALDATTIGWIERRGNRQYVGSGNITADGRVALIFVDYPSRTRLKLFGRATYHAQPSPELVAALEGEDVRGDGAITVEITATNWNCPKYITPRYTARQVASEASRAASVSGRASSPSTCSSTARS